MEEFDVFLPKLWTEGHGFATRSSVFVFVQLVLLTCAKREAKFMRRE